MDSEIGKFASVDPLVRDSRLFEVISDPQAFNAYAYSRNNPIVFVDPDGEDPFSIFLGVITFLFGDIPSAGENDDGEFSSSQSNEDWIYDNTDDMIVDRFVQNLPWHIKAPIKVGEFVVDQYGNINNDGESSDGNMTWDDSASEYTYVVESGDTMYDLFGDNYSDVAEYNGIEDPGKIQPGQEIRIPVE